MRILRIAGWAWALLLNASLVQAQVSFPPDQKIGLGGDFAGIDLSNYGSGVLWEADFIKPEHPAAAQDWSVVSTDYQFEMNITAVVYSKGTVASGDSHLLAVMNTEGTIHGVATAQQVQDDWVYFLTAYGNTAGEELQFVFYDAEYGQILKGATFSFNPNGIEGEPDRPLLVTAEILSKSLTNSKLTLHLSDTSFLGTEQILLTARSIADPTHSESDTLKLTVVDDFEPELIARIPDQIVAYGGGFQSIDLPHYMKSVDGDKVIYSVSSGTNVKATIDASNMATLSYPSGWSGTDTLIFTTTEQTTNAFSVSDTAVFTVRPKEQKPTVSGIPDQKVGEGGIPTDIYLSTYLTTNNPTGISWDYTVYSKETDADPKWSVNASDFEFNMSVTCEVRSFGKVLSGSSHTLAAFRATDSTLLGQTQAIAVKDQWYFFLTVNENTSGGAIFYRIYDADMEQVLPVSETDTFVSNAILGDPLEPVELNAGYIVPNIKSDTVSFKMLSDIWVGTQDIIFTATDTTTQNQLQGRDTMNIEVIDVQSPTFRAIPGKTIQEGGGFTQLNLADYLGGISSDMAVFSISGADTLSPKLQDDSLLTFTVPDENYFGTSLLKVTATHKDFAELTATTTVTLTVTNVNDAPVFPDQPDTLTLAGALYRYEVDGTDIDNTNLNLSITGNPDWLVFVANGGFGILFGTPTVDQTGDYAMTLSLTDGIDTTKQTFTLHVVNSYAFLDNIPTQKTSEGGLFDPVDLSAYTLKTDDYTVYYSVSGGDSLQATIDGAMLKVVILEENWYGSEDFTIRLMNLADSSELDKKVVTYQVDNVDDPPVVLTTDLPGATVGEIYKQTIRVKDIDNTALDYTINNSPKWLSVTPTLEGLLLYGVPTKADKGLQTINFNVSDGQLTTSQSFDLSITEVVLSAHELSDIKVYPNPVRDHVWIKAEKPVSTITLRDTSGKVVKVEIFARKTEVDWQLTGLQTGVYFLEVQSDNESVTRKLIVE